jgi:hypothetical protein
MRLLFSRGGSWDASSFNSSDCNNSLGVREACSEDRRRCRQRIQRKPRIGVGRRKRHWVGIWSGIGARLREDVRIW